MLGNGERGATVLARGACVLAVMALGCGSNRASLGEGAGGSGTGGPAGTGGAIPGAGGSTGAGGAGLGAGGTTAGDDGGIGPDTGAADAQSQGPATRAFVPTDEKVNSIVINDGVIYVGGYFISSSSTLFPAGIAALDEITLSNMPGWAPQVGPFVNALAATGGRVYAGLEIQADLLALDAVTGNSVSSLPSGNSAVTALAVGGGTIYFGGVFQLVGANPRYEFAAIDATSGALKSWAPNDIVNAGFPAAFAIDGNTVYAGGSFTLSHGSNGTRRYLAAIDATTGVATAWNPAPDGTVFALALSGQVLYVGGAFSTIAGEPRSNLAAFDSATGALLPFDAHVTGLDTEISSVRSLAVHEPTVYVGGRFSMVAGQPRDNLAAVDSSSAGLLPWSPPTTSSGAMTGVTVSTLAASATVVAAGVYGASDIGVAFYPPASP